jgi:hypothetical protein
MPLPRARFLLLRYAVSIDFLLKDMPKAGIFNNNAKNLIKRNIEYAYSGYWWDELYGAICGADIE